MDTIYYKDKDYAPVENFIVKHPTDRQAYEDLFEIIRSNDDLDKAKELIPRLGALLRDEGISYEDRNLLHHLLRNTHLFLAPHFFHNYMVYMEWDREPDKRFYRPRMQALYPVVEALQELADDRLDLLAISEPPGVGKTTLAEFFLTFIGGRNPNQSVLGGSHNAAFLRGVYDELLRMLTSEEYKYKDVFPKSQLVNTNAKDLRIDLANPKRFETFEFTSIGAGNAGKVRAQQLLYCDDLVDGIETAMSAVQLEKLWRDYTNDLRQRKQGDCKELHIATRWSVHDVIGRLEAVNDRNPRAKFLRYAALNENDESNFDYPYGLGFSTRFYKEQRDILDEPSWRALYMNEPIEREGLLYDRETLRTYFDLPAEEPDAVLGVCDTKDRGSDFCCLPVFYQYGNDFYLADVIYDNGLPEQTDSRLCDILVRHKVKMCRFESNSAGGRTAADVQKMVTEKGGFTKITTKYTTANKETKIFVNSAFVKEHYLFLDKSKCSKEYEKFMTDLCAYSHVGKNPHDDAPDAMAMFAEFVQGMAGNRVEIVKRPF